jgi:hypothetical protein
MRGKINPDPTIGILLYRKIKRMIKKDKEDDKVMILMMPFPLY